MDDATSSPDHVRFPNPLEVDSTATAAPPSVRGVSCRCQAPVLALAADAGPEAICQRCGGAVRMAWAAKP